MAAGRAGLGGLVWAGWAGLGGLGCAGVLCDALRSTAKKTISTTVNNCSPAQSREAFRSIMFTFCVLLAAAGTTQSFFAAHVPYYMIASPP